MSRTIRRSVTPSRGRVPYVRARNKVTFAPRISDGIDHEVTVRFTTPAKVADALERESLTDDSWTTGVWIDRNGFSITPSRARHVMLGEINLARLQEIEARARQLIEVTEVRLSDICRVKNPEAHLKGEFPLSCIACHEYENH